MHVRLFNVLLCHRLQLLYSVFVCYLCCSSVVYMYCASVFPSFRSAILPPMLHNLLSTSSLSNARSLSVLSDPFRRRASLLSLSPSSPLSQAIVVRYTDDHEERNDVSVLYLGCKGHAIHALLSLSFRSCYDVYMCTCMCVRV